MKCPDCGYVFSPFETTCARCARLGKPAPKTPSPALVPCIHCGQEIEPSLPSCKFCGAQQTAAAPTIQVLPATMLAPQSPPVGHPAGGALPRPRVQKLRIFTIAGLFVGIPAVAYVLWLRFAQSALFPDQSLIATWSSIETRQITWGEDCELRAEVHTQISLHANHRGTLRRQVIGTVAALTAADSSPQMTTVKYMQTWALGKLLLGYPKAEVFKVMNDFTSSTTTSAFSWSDGQEGNGKYLVTVSDGNGTVIRMWWSVTKDGKMLTLTPDGEKPAVYLRGGSPSEPTVPPNELRQHANTYTPSGPPN